MSILSMQASCERARAAYRMRAASELSDSLWRHRFDDAIRGEVVAEAEADMSRTDMELVAKAVRDGRLHLLDGGVTEEYADFREALRRYIESRQ